MYIANFSLLDKCDDSVVGLSAFFHFESCEDAFLPPQRLGDVAGGCQGVAMRFLAIARE